MIKAIIFDLDGTLLDTVDSMAYSCNKALDYYSIKSIERNRYKYFAGDGAEMLVRRALAFRNIENEEVFINVFNKYLDYFKLYCTYKVEVYDGIIELIKQLKQMKIKLAVLSNKPHDRTVDVINNFFDKDVFDVVQGQNSEIRKKPYPDGANLIINKLKLKKEECILVGDTSVDMQTGIAAKIKTIGVLWGFRTKEELMKNNAWRIITHPRDIIEIIIRNEGV